MRKSTLGMLVGAAALAAACGAASADDWRATGQFGWFGVGKVHQIEKGHVYFVGEFSGTFFSDKGDAGLFDKNGVKCPAFYDIDMNNKKGRAGGYCIVSDSAGNQAYINWSCEGDGVHCAGPFSYTGGTGKYAAASGSYSFLATTEVNWADGTVTGVSLWK
jgi:hypothetical protein